MNSLALFARARHAPKCAWTRFVLWLVVPLAVCSPEIASAQFGKPTLSPNGPQLDQELVQQYEVGVVVTADGGPCGNIVGTTAIPIDWPEQQVRIVAEDVSPFVQSITYRDIGATVKQMVIKIPSLPAGEEARAVVTVEVTRRSLAPPAHTSKLKVPERKKLSRDLKKYLGPSPYIESASGKIKSLSKQIVPDKDLPAWQKVERLYDWVREHVKYEEGKIKGALAALEEKSGDCEELTSLFIALCRAQGIPARMVWVPQHCYPEFYLVDEADEGHWFPCQAAGARDFGGIPELRPILQKGDQFKTPEKPRQTERYIKPYLTGTPLPGGGQPRVKFIGRVIAADAQAPVTP